MMRTPFWMTGLDFQILALQSAQEPERALLRQLSKTIGLFYHATIVLGMA